jgi:hypothetical protein
MCVLGGPNAHSRLHHHISAWHICARSSNQTQSVPTYVSPSGKLVVNTAVATIKGKYTVNSDGTLSGPFTITITPPHSGSVLFEANGSVKGIRLAE